jgi:hypothetical protein
MWHRSLWRIAANILEQAVASRSEYKSSLRCEKEDRRAPKRLYICTKLHCVIFQKTTFLILITVIRPNFKSLSADGAHDYQCRMGVTTKTNSGALVRQRTIPTEQSPLVGEVSANFSG